MDGDGADSVENGASRVAPAKYCVTGATGYIGSWLVKSLLQKGCIVHATARDPGKASYLLPKWNGQGHLKLFKADLQEEGSFNEAVKGCDGVFHVAASMEFNVHEQAGIENYVQSNIIDPAINGTLNLLKACKRSGSVKRVVFTSSISTMTAKTNDDKWIPVVDESCQVKEDHVRKSKANGWVYALSKVLCEGAAYNYANENMLDLVSIITTTVGGPFLTSTVPSSVRVLLSPLTGDPELLPILNAVISRMGSLGLVHIEDICNAHIFLMEHELAKGRYICCADCCRMPRLVELLAQANPCANIQRTIAHENERVPSMISSKKLKDLGFEYQYGVVDIINETTEHCIECGYLPTRKL